jgi:hypothetical protein
LDLVALAIAALCLWKFVNPKKHATTLRFILLVFSMSVVFALCPFLTLPKPIYVGFSENLISSGESAMVLKDGNQAFGSAFLLAQLDLPRRVISESLAAMFHDSFRIVTDHQQNDAQYMMLPIFDQFVIQSPPASDVPFTKSIFLPVDSLAFSMQLDLRNEPADDLFRTNHLEIGTDLSSFPFIDFAYDQFPETIPWEAVLVQKGQEKSTLHYVSLLDRSLELLVVGKITDGLSLLDSAARLLPSQNIEGARLATLKLAFVELCLSGNIASLQSIPYLHKAYASAIESQHDVRFSATDPLANWVRTKLLDSYRDFDWTGQFFDRIEVLEQMPHIEEKKPFTRNLENFIFAKSFDELMDDFNTNKYTTAELYAMRWLCLEKFCGWMLYQGSMANTNVSEEHRLDAVSSAARPAAVIIQRLDTLINNQHNSLKASPQLGQFLKFFTNDFARFGEETNPAIYTQEFLQFMSLSHFATAITNTMAAWSMANRIPPEKPAFSEWWTTGYLSWFSFWCSDATIEISNANHPDKLLDEPELRILNSRYVKHVLERFGPDVFSKDRGGSGVAFMPGLFILTWYADTLHLDSAPGLKAAFQKESLITFDTFLARLRPVEQSSYEIPVSPKL